MTHETATPRADGLPGGSGGGGGGGAPDTGARFRIGIDVGGTKIAGGLISADGRVQYATRVATPAMDGRDAICAAIADLARALAAHAPAGGTVTGIGIGTGGVVDHARGRIASATGLLADWAGTEVAEIVSIATGLPVGVDNDGNVLALGEARLGAAVGQDDALFIAVGTGIGGGLVLGGELRRGRHHSAGELGHIPVPGAEDRPCSCGGSGHLEAVSAGPAILRDYQRRASDTTHTDLRAVAALASEGDRHAIAAIELGARTLGSATAGLANTIDPGVIVFGGGVPAIGDLFWRPLRAAYAAEALPGTRETPLLPAALGDHAAILGAAMLADTAHPTTRSEE